MTYATDGAAIRQRWEAQWPGSGSPVIPYCFMDTKYDPPKDKPWLRLSVLTGAEGQVTMGKTRRFRKAGIVDVGIFVPVGSGDGLPKQVADRVAAIFRGRTVAGIIFRACSLERVGVDGPWVQWTCTVPYQSDEDVLNPN
jgi:hypothetical protein